MIGIGLGGLIIRRGRPGERVGLVVAGVVCGGRFGGLGVTEGVAAGSAWWWPGVAGVVVGVAADFVGFGSGVCGGVFAGPVSGRLWGCFRRGGWVGEDHFVGPFAGGFDGSDAVGGAF